jgi:rhodanese-related sulfurtransferase
MNLLPSIRNCALLLSVAAVPAVAQLVWHGWRIPAASPHTVSVAELAGKGAVLWVDAREESLFKEQHVPGAINLNQNNWERELAKLFEQFAPGQTVVVYCSAACQESERIATRIRELGIEPVLVLDGGFEAWKQRR